MFLPVAAQWPEQSSKFATRVGKGTSVALFHKAGDTLAVAAGITQIYDD